MTHEITKDIREELGGYTTKISKIIAKRKASELIVRKSEVWVDMMDLLDEIYGED